MALQIGSASFANKYGLLNEEMLSNEKEIEKIILFCKKKDLILDSSPEYGKSIKYINNLSKGFKSRISTKVVVGKDDLDSFEKKLINHFKNLKNCSIETLYFHEPKISHNKDFQKYLKSASIICNDFNINNLGLSIYEEEDLISENCNLELINCLQVPLNLLDNRNIALKQKYKKISLIGRSIFLQGLITTSGIEMLGKSSNKTDQQNGLLIKNLSKKFATNIETLAIAWALSFESIKDIIIGVNSYKQLIEIFEFYEKAKLICHKIKDNQSLFYEIEKNGSTFKRWLPILAGK